MTAFARIVCPARIRVAALGVLFAVSVSLAILPVTSRAQLAPPKPAGGGDSNSGSASGGGTAVGEAAFAFALFDDAVEKLVLNSYYQQTRGDIYQSALTALFAQLGDRFAAYKPASLGATDGEAALVFKNTLTTLSQAPGQTGDIRALIDDTLSAYCASLDTHSRYVTERDFSALQRAKSRGYSGIGMELRMVDGEFLCFPFPGEPAAVAGIKDEDRLVTVDGRSVGGKSLYAVASMLLGPPGTNVSVKVRPAVGRAATFDVPREALATSSVTVTSDITGISIHIRKFDKETLTAFEDALTNIRPNQSLTVDLRDCRGGELAAAIRIADMLLPKDAVIVKHERVRDGQLSTDTYRSENEPLARPLSILVLQNERTASAGELLLLALTETPSLRAVSQGPDTYGKALTQEPVLIAGGARLEITNGRLYSPGGYTWEEVGIPSSLSRNGKPLAPNSPAPAPAPSPASAPSTTATPLSHPDTTSTTTPPAKAPFNPPSSPATVKPMPKAAPDPFANPDINTSGKKAPFNPPPSTTPSSPAGSGPKPAPDPFDNPDINTSGSTSEGKAPFKISGGETGEGKISK